MTNKQAIAIMEQQKNEFLDEYVDFGGVTEAYNMAIKALEQPEPSAEECACCVLMKKPESCNLPQLDATYDDEGDILIKGVKFPKGCVYEGENGKTEYCFLCNHADVPFCMYIEWEPEAAIGVDERPCYCPLKEQESCEDAVSATAVIKAVDRHTDDDGRLDDDISCILEEVPFVKPVPPKCDDAISRSAVISVIKRSDIFSTYTELDDIDDIVADVIDEARKQLVDNVNALPSVTPKKRTGEWVDIWKDNGVSDEAKCSKCGKVSARPVGAYCKWCGAKMNGGDQDE